MKRNITSESTSADAPTSARSPNLPILAAGMEPDRRDLCKPEAITDEAGVELRKVTHVMDPETQRIPARDQYGDLRDAPNMTLAEARLFLDRGHFLRELGMWKLELELRQREHEVAEREQKVEARKYELERREQAIAVLGECDKFANQGIWEEDLPQTTNTGKVEEAEYRGSAVVELESLIKEIIKEALANEDREKLGLGNLKGNSSKLELTKAIQEHDDMRREARPLEVRHLVNQWWVARMKEINWGDVFLLEGRRSGGDTFP